MTDFVFIVLLVAGSIGTCVSQHVREHTPTPHCPAREETERIQSEIRAEVREILESRARYTCNGTPGWRRVVMLDMTDPTQECPAGLRFTARENIRLCGSLHTGSNQCSSTSFSVSGVEYSKVCGRVRAFQQAQTQAFHGSFAGERSIDRSYLDGVSLTHGPAGGGREHIWSLAAGRAEVFLASNTHLCPCDNGNQDLPSFIGQDFFCETGNDHNEEPPRSFFSDDPLWDGEMCSPSSTCCQFNNPPWFTKMLPTPTTNDIDLRICHTHVRDSGDIPIQLVELYVQ